MPRCEPSSNGRSPRVAWELVETVESKWVELTEVGQNYRNGTPELKLLATLTRGG